MGCGVAAAVVLPLGAALFLLVSLLTFVQSFPGGDTVAAAMGHLAGAESPALGKYSVAPGPITQATLQPFEPDIQAASGRYEVDPRLVRAVILQESGGDPRATSRVGAAGLMQLMPGTFAEMGYDPIRIYEPAINIEAGVRYLAQGLSAFGGDVYWAAAAYNAGIAGARRLKATYGYVPASFAGGETRRYVEAILALLEGN